MGTSSSQVTRKFHFWLPLACGGITEADISEDVEPLVEEVPEWVRGAREVVKGDEPDIAMGDHYSTPYDCPFPSYCGAGEPQPEYPISLLPSIRRPQLRALQAQGYEDLRDVPDSALSNPRHLRVLACTRSRERYLDDSLREGLRELAYPRYYLDFETVQFTVPIWAGTRPYEQLPFQWSLHIEKDPAGTPHHREFLADGAEAPHRAFAEALIKAAGTEGPVVVYSHFESRVIRELVKRFPDLAPSLMAIHERLVDLLPMMRDGYYHPDMMGSWSIKQVLPTVDPTLGYDTLEGVHDGTEAQTAYVQMIHPQTPGDRAAVLREQLLAYCKLDTEAMLALVRQLAA